MLSASYFLEKKRQERELRKKYTPFIEFEGYMINKKFYFKEVAVYDEATKEQVHLFITTPKLSGPTYNWLTNFFHQIPHSYGDISYKYQLLPLLTQFQVIFVKGEIKKQILENITPAIVINIEHFGCPSYRLLPVPSEVNCKFHTDNNNHCALYKLKQVQHWLDNGHSTTLREALSLESAKVSQSDN